LYLEVSRVSRCRPLEWMFVVGCCAVGGRLGGADDVIVMDARCGGGGLNQMLGISEYDIFY
jgi:hypothetical protein